MISNNNYFISKKMKLPKSVILLLGITATVEAQYNAWLYYGNC